MSQMIPIDHLLNEAFGHHQAGRMPDAEALYRQILSQQPDHPDVLHLLGVLACQMDRNDAAVELIRRAIALFPHQPAYYSNLGEALRKLGRIDDALVAFRQAIAIDPGFTDAYINYGICLYHTGKIDGAREVFRSGRCAIPGHAPLHRHFADMLVQSRRWDEAIAAYELAIRLQPSLLDAHYNMAGVLASQGRPQEAAAAYATVVAASPNDMDARMGLADALSNLNRHADALQMYQSVIDGSPAHAQAYHGQANVWRACDRLDEAIVSFRKALACKPDPDPVIQANLGFALRDYAELEEAVVLLRAAVAALPGSAAIRSGLIFTLQVVPSASPEMIAVEERRWNDMHVRPFLGTRKACDNDPSPGRRLKIGYVSGDLRNHPVGRFLLPLLLHHDRAQVEIFCYSSTAQPDALTAQLRSAANQWRQVSGMNDDELAQLVRRDRIDILIDLSMHAVKNRLLTFAQKPAPIQLTYLAYCSGTGLETIDYRLTDRYIDPTESPVSSLVPERPLYLETYWCYAPMDCAGEVNPLPARAAGHVTFGSFNYFCKVNTEVLDTWAALLGDVPNSRLMLHVPAGSRQSVVRQFFALRRIDPSRLTLVPRTLEAEYFRHYGSIDIALDVFPFAGGTTTCDALWMGVPVVTLAAAPGERTVSRGGVSILSTVALTDLIGHDRAEYCHIAKSLAANIDHLEYLRSSLRSRMQHSLLMNAPRFARGMERAFRRAWKSWCAVPR